MFGTAPTAHEDAEIFGACDGCNPEFAGHVAIDVLPRSVHCSVGRRRGRGTIWLATFGYDAGGAACVWELAFAWLFDAVNVDFFENVVVGRGRVDGDRSSIAFGRWTFQPSQSSSELA